LLKQKVAQNVTISLGYFILSKNHNEPSKVAQLAKNLVTLAVGQRKMLMVLTPGANVIKLFCP
jgi:hypothetical protein